MNLHVIDTDGTRHEAGRTKVNFLHELDALTKEYFDRSEEAKNAPKAKRTNTNIALIQAETKFKNLLREANDELDPDEFIEFYRIVEVRVNSLNMIGDLNVKRGTTRRKIARSIGATVGTAGDVIAATSEGLAEPTQRFAAALGKAFGGVLVGLTYGTYKGVKAGINFVRKVA